MEIVPHNTQTGAGANLAERSLAKSSTMYSNSGWDLVDAEAGGMPVEEVAEDALPAAMKKMSKKERKKYVAGKKADREKIKKYRCGSSTDRRNR